MPHQGSHVMLTCENHPDLRWSCKWMAITDRRYNGSRSLFFHGQVANGKFVPGSDDTGGDGHYIHECDCPATALILMEGEENKP